MQVGEGVISSGVGLGYFDDWVSFSSRRRIFTLLTDSWYAMPRKKANIGKIINIVRASAFENGVTVVKDFGSGIPISIP